MNRRRVEPRHHDAAPLGRALDILELLASRPTGLTVLEIAARLECPVAEVTGVIASMQTRHWLRSEARTEEITLGARVIDLAKIRP